VGAEQWLRACTAHSLPRARSCHCCAFTGGGSYSQGLPVAFRVVLKHTRHGRKAFHPRFAIGNNGSRSQSVPPRGHDADAIRARQAACAALMCARPRGRRETIAPVEVRLWVAGRRSGRGHCRASPGACFFSPAAATAAACTEVDGRLRTQRPWPQHPSNRTPRLAAVAPAMGHRSGHQRNASFDIGSAADKTPSEHTPAQATSVSGIAKAQI
jgi:hypothetical protein